VVGFKVGVGLGDFPGWGLKHELLSVQIQANQIENTWIGIQLGPVGSEVYWGELRQVAIMENSIVADAVGIMVNGRAGTSALNLDRENGADVRIADNIVTSRVGIGVIGQNIGVV